MPLPERQQVKADLIALIRECGGVSSADAYEALAAKWNLNNVERTRVRAGTLLYRHEIRWARQELVVEGIICRSHRRGEAWRLTGPEPFVISRPKGPDCRPIFSAGHHPRVPHGKAPSRAESWGLILRHNVLVGMLHDQLAKEFGPAAVGTEQPSGRGGYVDLVLRVGKGRYWIYEVKVASSAAEAIRLAFGQLMEYSYRPGCWEPQRLVIAAEPALDDESRAFLRRMRREFRLPLAYHQIL